MKSFFNVSGLTVLLIASLLTYSFAQIDWTKDTTNNPILDPGDPGEWDDRLVFSPCVIYEDSLYRMWYGGDDGATFRIGYATSPDGIDWKKDTLNNPVLDVGESGRWDDSSVHNPSVLFRDSVYQMWYSGQDGSTTRIGYATSPDGFNWTKDTLNNPVFFGTAGSWNETGVSWPSVRFDGSSYHMYFGGWGVSFLASIGYGTSTDGITWTEYANNPILVAGTNSWDDVQVSVPDVIFDGTRYHMLYTGQNTPNWFWWRIGYALSEDGINWIKYDSNPVLTSSAGSWDSQSVGYAGVILDEPNSIFKMWYTGGAADWDGHIGYATAPADCVITTISVLNANFPDDYLLHQNYPNPFNPTTTIEFDLPNTAEVSLKVFNILGEEVATLVSDRLSAGSYTYEWDASNLASGVYLYKLQVGDPSQNTGQGPSQGAGRGFVETRKMVLMR